VVPLQLRDICAQAHSTGAFTVAICQK
jgi:hypothetical protein